MSRSRRLTKLCPVCHRSYYPWSHSARWCSNACQQEADYQKRLAIVKASGNWALGWLDVGRIRRALLRERKHVCIICGSTHWLGKPIPLVMDHIDGNSDNWADNNLRLVCGNCDMQLPTYKGKNRGKGRFLRRLRYKYGKSY